MATILLYKRGGALFPVDDKDRERLRRVGQGEIVGFEHKKARNWKNHRRYFRFVEETFAMQDEFANEKVWRKYLQCLAGHYDLNVLTNGKTFYVPRSIAWAELEEPDFQELFGQCVDAFIDWYEKRYGPLPHEAMMRVMGFL